MPTNKLIGKFSFLERKKSMLSEIFTLIPYVLLWAGGTIVNGILAKDKGKDASTAVVLSVITSPLFVYLYLLATPPVQKG